MIIFLNIENPVCQHHDIKGEGWPKTVAWYDNNNNIIIIIIIIVEKKFPLVAHGPHQEAQSILPLQPHSTLASPLPPSSHLFFATSPHLTHPSKDRVIFAKQVKDDTMNNKVFILKPSDGKPLKLDTAVSSRKEPVIPQSHSVRLHITS